MPSIETARVIAAALGVSVGALMGEAVEGLSSEEALLVRDYRTLPEPRRAEVRSFMAYLRATRVGDTSAD